MADYGIPYNGNIDLNSRKVYIDPNSGAIQTEYSIGISDNNGTEYLIPTIIDGKPVDPETAIAYFHKTGKYLGKHPTPKDNSGWKLLEDYAKRIHQRQDSYYGDRNRSIGSGLGLGNELVETIDANRSR